MYICKFEAVVLSALDARYIYKPPGHTWMTCILTTNPRLPFCRFHIRPMRARTKYRLIASLTWLDMQAADLTSQHASPMSSEPRFVSGPTRSFLRINALLRSIAGRDTKVDSTRRSLELSSLLPSYRWATQFICASSHCRGHESISFNLHPSEAETSDERCQERRSLDKQGTRMGPPRQSSSDRSF